ncbi:restriction endonuclease [Vallitaleaceae bacterium 9-2]
MNHNLFFPNYDSLNRELENLEELTKSKDKKNNRKKGKALEKFASLIFSFCVNYEGYEDVNTKTNQIDIKINLKPIPFPEPFITHLGYTIIVECKNENHSVSSREVDNLSTLLTDYDSKLGIFLSRKDISGNSNEDGKRRAINQYYAHKHTIICITFDEIKKRVIENKESFICLIEEKYNEFHDSK